MTDPASVAAGVNGEGLVLHRCLDCSAQLRRQRDRMRCPACAAEWPCVDGVPVYDSAKYFGEVSRDEAAALVETARRENWRTAARRYQESNPGLYQYIADLNRAGWASLLPLRPESTVLDVGSGLGALTHALALTYDRVVSIEPIPERIQFTQARIEQEGLRNVELVQTTLARLPFFDSTFDLIVLNGILEWVGEWRTDVSPREAQQLALRTLRRMLKPRGILLIGIENRFSWGSFLGALDHSGLAYTNLMPRWIASLYLQARSPSFYRTSIDARRGYRTYTYSRRGYAKLLHDAGFASQEFWWPINGYNLPLTMFRLDHRDRLIAGLQSEDGIRRRLSGFSVRRALKHWLLLRTGWIRHFVPDFVIVAREDEGGPDGGELGEEGQDSVLGAIGKTLATKVPGRGRDGDRLSCSVVSSQGFRNKQVLEIVDRAYARIAIAKLANVRRPGHERVERGSRHQAWIRRTLAGGGPTVVDSVCTPLGVVRCGNIVVAVESAAEGSRLHDLAMHRGYFRDRGTVRHHLRLLTDWLVAFQRCVQSVALPKTLRRIPVEWRHGPGEMRPATAPELPSWIQHGDFFPENIFVAADSRGIMVVDWDDLGSGYPPLFDFFCLITGFYYAGSSGRATEAQSFRHTYLHRNWFSDVVRDHALSILNALDLGSVDVERCFLEYLAVRYNQFRHVVEPDTPDLQSRAYEEYRTRVLAEPDSLIFAGTRGVQASGRQGLPEDARSR
jgi:SAM-dependent methyltransferase